MGNNGMLGPEHHPMKLLYGYSIAAGSEPETRYDEVSGPRLPRRAGPLAE